MRILWAELSSRKRKSGPTETEGLGGVEVLHTQGPVDGSLYATVRRSAPEPAVPAGSPDHSDHALSVSSDSGHSTASARTDRTEEPPGPRALSPQEKAALDQLLSGFGLEDPGTPLQDMTEAGGRVSGTRHVVPAQVHVNGDATPKDRETDILDDEVPAHDLRSAGSVGTLSSSEGHPSAALGPFAGRQSSHNSLLSDGLGSSAGEDPHGAHGADPGPGGGPLCGREAFGGCEPQLPRPELRAPCALAQAQAYEPGGYPTQTWVRQQQMVATHQYSFAPAGEARLVARGTADSARAAQAPPGHPAAPAQGAGSRVAVGSGPHPPDTQRPAPGKARLPGVCVVNGTGPEPGPDPTPGSPTLDIDHSIEQLNRLILELDPTFEPLPTHLNKLGGLASSPSAPGGVGGGPRASGRLQDRGEDAGRAPGPQGSPGDELLRRRFRKLSLGQYDNHVGGPAFPQCGWGTPPFLSPADAKEMGTPDEGAVDGRAFSPSKTGSCGSPTPAFPLSPPPTPYEALARSVGMSESLVGPGAAGPPFPRAPAGSPGAGGDSPLSAERLWVDTGPKPTPAPPGSSRPPRSLLGPSELPGPGPGRPHLPPAELPLRGHPLAEPPGVLDPASSPAFLGSGAAPGGGGLPPAQAPGALRAAAATADNGFLPPFPPGGHGHGHGPLTGQPPLPEKKRASEGDHSLGSISPTSSGFSSPHSGSTMSIPFPSVLPDFSKPPEAAPAPENPGEKQVTVSFVQDTSKFWYKADISREQAIAMLRDKEPGSFVVRDSHSFRGAYGLAMKVATPPPSVLQLHKKAGDLANELVRHFLVECTPKGVRLKGCSNEPYFGSLTALVCQHSITPLALPCKLLIPDRDPLEEVTDSPAQTAASSAAELLKQGAACNVWYLSSTELESLTGPQAVQKALSTALAQQPPPLSTVVHFKVSAQGITLTDNQRKLFFRRHYPVSSVIFCALDPQDRKWIADGQECRVFGLVARKQGSATDNVCHLFAEHDPEQPASAIVNFVSKVMIGSPRRI
uniref:Tensin 3 n=1 Tax=Pipistrellus kuhlii TaxID=59472 RepID=A0A7J7TNM2_PIPKU|nr:tensin 3 [Pipistrellus kuhlii]